MPVLAALLLYDAAGAEPERLDSEHESRVWTSGDGLLATATSTVDQDDRGFLWVSTAEGVARLDGAGVTRMTSPGWSTVRGSGAANRVVVIDRGGVPADVLGPMALRALAVPLELPISTTSLQVDRQGRLWLATGDRVMVEASGAFRDVSGPWSAGPSTSDAPRIVGAGRDGTVFVEVAGRLGRVSERGWTDLGPSIGALAAVEHGDGSVVTAANEDLVAGNRGAVFVHRAGQGHRLYAGDSRAIDVVSDGTDLFLATDHQVVRITPEGTADPITSEACCGRILVDREGGVWIAGELGLRHVPSPRTATWRTSTIRLVPAPDGLWTPTWGGMRRLRFTSAGLEVTSWPHPAAAACPDPRGDVWTLGRSTTRRFRDGADPEELPGAGVSGTFQGCAAGAAGRTWFASPFGLMVSDPRDPVPHRVPGATPTIPEAGPWSLTAVLEADGVLTYAVLGHLCRAEVDRVLTETDPGWSCVVLPAPAEVLDLALADGERWAAVRHVGVMRSAPRSDVWTPIPASATLRTGTLGLLAPSPRGGTWVASEGDVIRVVGAPGEPDGWRVLERLGAAQGVRDEVSPREIVETDAVWLLDVDGSVTRVADDARSAPAAPPPVFLAAVQTESGPHDPGQPLVLEASRNRLALQFAAPVFGQRAGLVYRFRLRPGDPWSAPTPDETLQFAALGTGRYRAEVAASLDGKHWSPVPAVFAFRVRAPWHLRPPFLLGCVAAVAGAGWVVHRAQLRAAMRLERQRARIARDLHDEIGSGLGSIGVLAGVAARYGGQARSAELVERIADLAAELGLGLTDIVTSLRGGAANLRALHGHVVERGTAACAAGRPRFEAQPSETVPAVPLSVPVRINTFLIAVEAIHNAVRHSGAQVVTLRLDRDGRRRWRLTVSDDGVGLPPSHPERASGGVGLRSMVERAEEIGATLTLHTPAGGGTELQLSFDPTAEERR